MSAPWYGIAVIVDASTTRLHACWFTQRPFAGGDTSFGLRWQSRGHHTAGAADEIELAAHMEGLADVIRGRFKVTDIASLGRYEWNGEGVPAMIPITSAQPSLWDPAADQASS